MSTKLHEAWRIPVGNIHEFAAAFRQHKLAELYEEISGLFAELKDPEIREIKSNTKRSEGTLYRMAFAFEHYVLPRYQWASANNKPLWNRDSGLCVGVYGAYAYIYSLGQQYCDVPFRPTQEYEYWDNTDRPKQYSAQEWAKRSRIWGALLKNDALLEFTAISFKPGAVETIARVQLAMEQGLITEPSAWIK